MLALHNIPEVKIIRTAANVHVRSDYEALPPGHGFYWCFFFRNEASWLQLLHPPLEIVSSADLVHPEQLHEIDVSHRLNPVLLSSLIAKCLNTARENRPREKGAFFMSDQPSRREELSRGLLAT